MLLFFNPFILKLLKFLFVSDKMSDSNKSELVFVKVEFESPVKEDLENIKREDHLSIKTEGGMHFF